MTGTTKIGRPETWTEKELKKLKKLYPKTADKDLPALFPPRHLKTIKTKAQRLGLKKENGRWTEEEETRLLREWPTSSAEEISGMLGKTKWAVINKYRELTGKR